MAGKHTGRASEDPTNFGGDWDPRTDRAFAEGYRGIPATNPHVSGTPDYDAYEAGAASTLGYETDGNKGASPVTLNDATLQGPIGTDWTDTGNPGSTVGGGVLVIHETFGAVTNSTVSGLETGQSYDVTFSGGGPDETVTCQLSGASSATPFGPGVGTVTVNNVAGVTEPDTLVLTCAGGTPATFPASTITITKN